MSREGEPAARGRSGDAGAPAPVLRRMRWWDAAAVAAAERDLFLADAWSEEGVWGELAAPGRWYVVAVEPAPGRSAGEGGAEDESLLGYAGLAGPFDRGGDADVATVAVLERAQRRGVGRLLLRALLAEALARGAASVLLEVRVGNHGAAALYEAEGFERIAVRRRYYADGSDAEVMRWRPSPPRPAVGPASGPAPGPASVLA